MRAGGRVVTGRLRALAALLQPTITPIEEPAPSETESLARVDAARRAFDEELDRHNNEWINR